MKKNKNFDCFGISINVITTNFLKIILVVSILFLISKGIKKTYAYKVGELVNSSINVSERVFEIRNTKNTDITKRDGKIFYVSANGDDNNDGLSPMNAWKTLDKVNLSFTENVINNKDTVLFNRGDIFRGYLNISENDILLGSYGDDNLSKPEILVSPFDGAKSGEWVNVEANIWKYTIDAENPFKDDVGVIWFYSKDGTYNYGQKIITPESFDETNLDIKTLLDSDLEFYQTGHPYTYWARAKELYVYSEINPAERFERIEFAIAKSGIRLHSSTDLTVDNLTIKYAGVHGIAAGTLANLKVTNCEFGYIGGATQNLNNNSFVRFGNAIEIYGSVQPTNDYEVKEGFIVRNNYIYQVYDAGITFQFTTETESKIENAVFDNNVIEYCNYSIEYWNKTDSTNIEDQENTYINNYEITNNIMRYAGMGVSQTRPDKNQSAHIKTWVNPGTYYNRVKGKYVIAKNIFDTSSEQVFWIHAGEDTSLPQVINNTFYNSYKIKLGYYFAGSSKYEIPYIQDKLEQVFPNNKYYYLENDLGTYSNNGISGDVNWDYDNDTGILHITGTGRMKDYSLTNLPEWYKSRMFIKKIIIDENVSYIGKYAFYDLPYVEELEINCKRLDDFSTSGINIGDNYSFYKTGSGWVGMNVTFGEEVTVIPAYMFWPGSMDYEGPTIKNIEFKGNKIKTIKNHAFIGLRVPIVVIPLGVETIETLAFANTSYTKAISVPDTVKRIDSWAFGGNTGLEKIVFGRNVKQINEYMLSGSHSLKEVIFTSDIEFNSNNYNGLFSNVSENTIIYGNDSVKKLVSEYCENTNTSNIKYLSIDEYKININLNTDLLEFKNNEYKIGDILELSLKEGYKINNIDIYQKYQNLDGISYTIYKITLSNMDNIAISVSYWDIDILVNISKIENDKEDTQHEEDDVDKPIITENPDIKNDKEEDIPHENNVSKPIVTEKPVIKDDKEDTQQEAEEEKAEETTEDKKDNSNNDKKDLNIKDNSENKTFVSNENNNIWIKISLIIILGVIVCSVIIVSIKKII